KQNEMLLSPGGILPKRGAARFLQRFRKQTIGAISSLVGAEVVDFLEIFAVHLRERDEFENIDHSRRLLLERLELLRAQYHILILRELVALYDFVARDHLVVVFGTNQLL